VKNVKERFSVCACGSGLKNGERFKAHGAGEKYMFRVPCVIHTYLILTLKIPWFKVNQKSGTLNHGF
jgi:hypothetical protein